MSINSVCPYYLSYYYRPTEKGTGYFLSILTPSPHTLLISPEPIYKK